MIRKIVFMAGVLVALMAGPAMAQYNDSFVAPNSASPGAPIAVSGVGATAGGTISFYLSSASGSTSRFVGSTVAASDGTFAASITIPANVGTGQYVLTARGAGINQVQTIQVVGSSSGTGTGGTGTGTGTGTGVAGGTGAGTGTALPRTGSSNLQPLAIAGALCVGTGGLLVLATRRRHSASVAA